MTFTPKVSIVIPVYNGSNYLAEAIDSALNQTYHNIEIIVINDGSNDNGKTAKIAKSYGDKIRYYEKENGGVATALNLGIEKMTGEYFSWLSHDDMYKPDKVEKQITYLSGLSDKNVVLYSNYYIYEEATGEERKVDIPSEVFEDKPENLLFREAINGVTMLVPKGIFIDCGVFDEKLKTTQDYNMWFRVMRKGYKFIHQHDYLAAYRVHDGQGTKVSKTKNTEDDDLFLYMIKSMGWADMERLEGTVENFYNQIGQLIENREFLNTKRYIESTNRDSYNPLDSLDESTAETIAKIKSLRAKVTIITPTYNRDELIKDTVRSILAQDYENYVYIILDDGSTDNTKRNVLELIKNKKNCFYIYNQNVGEAETVNIGWNLCYGEYFLQVNSDDTIEPGLLSEMTGALDDKPDHILAYPDFYFINDAGEIIKECKNEDWNFIDSLSSFSCHAAAPGTLIRKSELAYLKKIKDKRYRYINDIKMLWNMALVGDFVHVPKTLASWRSHTDGISATRYKSIGEVRTWFDEYFSQKGLPKEIRDCKSKCLQSIDAYCIGLLEDGAVESVIVNYIKDLHTRYNLAILQKEGLLLSKSWRITKPFRYVTSKLASLRDRL